MGTPSFSFVPTLFPFRLFPIVEEKRRGIFREIVFATGNLGEGEEENGNRSAFDLCEISFLEIRAIKIDWKWSWNRAKYFRWIISSSVWIIEIRRNRRYLEVNQIYILTGFSIFSSFGESRLWFWGRKVSRVRGRCSNFEKRKKIHYCEIRGRVPVEAYPSIIMQVAL